MDRRFLVLVSRFNEFITKALLSGAQEAFADAGVDESRIDVLWLPGAFELPVAAGKAARSRAYTGIVALGAVIRGETPHFDYVAGEAAAGLARIASETGVPIGFGLLTTDNAEQALARCGIKGSNKGAEAVQATLATVKALDKLEQLSGMVRR